MPAQVTHHTTLLLRFLCLGCGLLILAASMQHALQSGLAQRPPGPSPFGEDRLISVGDRSIFVRCQGAGSPLVLLESGLGGSVGEWSLVQDALARQTTVCAYDRAGEGRSDPDPAAPRNAEDVARDLDAVLQHLQVEQPIVLAGFSVGGLLARYYATTRPRDVAALVLIDATPPVWTAMNLSGATIEPRIDGLLRFSGLHPRAAEQLDILKAAEQVFMLAAPPLPVWMLSSGVKSLTAGIAGDQRARIATRLQDDQARELDAHHEIIPGCTHAMPIACPEAVTAAITAALEEARRSSAHQTEDPLAILPDPSRRTTKKRHAPAQRAQWT